MSPTRSEYKELGLELVSLEEKALARPRELSWQEKRNMTGQEILSKMFLEEALMQQRNEMMDSFTQILWQLPIGNTYSSRGGIVPFKVQINFDILVFEGYIDADVVEKWLNILKGYFLSINFRIEKILLLHSSNSFPMSKIGGKLSVNKRKQKNPHYLQSRPPGNPSRMLLRNNTTVLEVMMTCIPNGPHCRQKETKQCQSSQISSIPCAPS
jgi:hypothetical protein